MSKRLSLCIPSFDQLEGLKLTLESISRSPLALSENVEVLISDNASADRKTLNKIKASHPSFNWIDQEVNLGFRGNLEALITNSTGEAIWFIGCGDLPFVNVEDLEHILSLTPKAALTFGTSYVSKFADSQDAIVDPGASWSLISCSEKRTMYETAFNSMVLPRHIWSLYFANPSVTGDYWPHLEALLLAHKTTLQIFKSTKKLVVHDDSPGSWWNGDQALKIVVEESRVLAFYSHRGCKPIRHHLLNHALVAIPHAIVTADTSDSKSTLSFRDLSHLSFPFKVLAWSTSRAPKTSLALVKTVLRISSYLKTRLLRHV